MEVDDAAVQPGTARRAARRGPLILVIIVGMMLAVAIARQRQTSPAEIRQRLQEGLAAHRKGDLESAIDAYNDVIDKDPGNKFAHFNLGVIHHRGKKTKEAEKDYRRALRTDPDFVPALFNLGVIRQEQEAYEDAAALYRKVIEQDPEAAEAHFNLGYLLVRRLNRPEEGREVLARAVEINPNLRSKAGTAPSTGTAEP